MGSGRTELARLVFGVDRPDGGQISVHGRPVTLRSPDDAIRHGIALVPEDRKTQGLVLCLDVVDNVNMASLRTSSVVLSDARLGDAAQRQAQALGLRAGSLGYEVQYLSGGNQQKVVLGKWLETAADVFIFDEPTRGVDVGAKLEIHRLLIDLARHGKALLIISSDMPEVLALSDRILEGGLTPEPMMGEVAVQPEQVPDDPHELKMGQMAIDDVHEIKGDIAIE